MSGEPLRENPHETLCGERGIGFPLATSKIARLYG